MHAVTISAPGGPESLVWSDVPDPVPGPGEVLIDVTASAVNRADLLQRAGNYSPPPGASPYPGLECSGRVVAIGPDQGQHPDQRQDPGRERDPDQRQDPGRGRDPHRGQDPGERQDPDQGRENASGGIRIGDEVCALLAGGGYAEQVAVPAGQVLPVPQGLTVAEAAALPEVACTVWSNVIQLAGLRPGETLLVHGGGSGIGTFAIQLGTAYGAQVIATARAGKHRALRELGADVTVDYATEDFVAAVKQATGNRGADVILDIMGAAYLSRNVDALAANGRLVIIGLQGGRRAELDLGTALAKRASISATTLRARPPQEKAEIVRGVREQVWPLVEAGKVRPVIDRRLPMWQAAQAHQVVEASEHLGKVLLLTHP